MTALLDVNVVIALLDPLHVAHDASHAWFDTAQHRGWATCPLTQNGVVRIVGHPKYPNTPGSPAAAAEVLAKFVRRPGHVFWPDDVSLLDEDRLDRSRLLAPGQVTDSYLLALAVAHGGRLATLDRRLVATAVRGGAAALELIDSR